jgi:hypothetical protein
MSTDDVLLGLGLVIVLAVGSQLVAGRAPAAEAGDRIIALVAAR